MFKAVRARDMHDEGHHESKLLRQQAAAWRIIRADANITAER